MKEVCFTIKCPPNTSNMRLHWAVKYQLFKRVRKEVWAALAESKQLPTAHAKLVLAKSPEKRLVTFLRFFGGSHREMDHDGFANATKPVLDALKLGDNGEGLIYDDAPSWCAVIWDQEKVGLKEKLARGRLAVRIRSV